MFSPWQKYKNHNPSWHDCAVFVSEKSAAVEKLLLNAKEKEKADEHHVMQWACTTQAVKHTSLQSDKVISSFFSLSKPLTEMSFNAQMWSTCYIIFRPMICDVNPREENNKGLHETTTNSQHHRLGIQHLFRSAVTWQEQISTSLTVTNDSKRLYSSQRPFWAPNASVNLCWWAHFFCWLTSIHGWRERETGKIYVRGETDRSTVKGCFLLRDLTSSQPLITGFIISRWTCSSLIYSSFTSTA